MTILLNLLCAVWVLVGILFIGFLVRELVRKPPEPLEQLHASPNGKVVVLEERRR